MFLNFYCFSVEYELKYWPDARSAKILLYTVRNVLFHFYRNTETCVMFVHFFRAIFLACFLYIDMISCPGYNVNSLQRTLSLCGNFIYKQNLLCRDADLSPFRSCHDDQTPIILVLTPYRCTILCLAISPKLLIWRVPAHTHDHVSWLTISAGTWVNG